jgi:hypothetical protein
MLQSSNFGMREPSASSHFLVLTLLPREDRQLIARKRCPPPHILSQSVHLSVSMLNVSQAPFPHS